MTDYDAFLQSKLLVVQGSGFDVELDTLDPKLFPFQRDLVRWAIRKGRAALFADTGLGKTACQLSWAQLVYRHTGRDVLILAPLAVAQQTLDEGRKFGIPVTLCRTRMDVRPGINITNYDRLHHFSADWFVAVVLDESSLLKDVSGKTRQQLTEQFAETPYRLCCTATPAPNDIAEIANHAEFLGVMTRTEMLASFFVHDDEGWRLKGHARQPFYRWMASWGMSLKKPSNLGYTDEGYELPPLEIRAEIVPVDYAPPGQLFFTGLKGIQDRAAVRRSTMPARVERVITLVREVRPDAQWVVWCGLNAEQDAVAQALGNACVSIHGSLSSDEKVMLHEQWLNGQRRVLVTKLSIFGHGLNWQHCNYMVFCGLSDSYEAYYQGVRRCWRFGQRQSVQTYIVLAEPEEAIYQNVLRKERQAEEISAELIREVSSFEIEEIGTATRRLDYRPQQLMRLPTWLHQLVVV